MKQIEKFYGMVRLVFLEQMAYTKAMWFDIMAALTSIFIYYFLWQVVFQDRNEMAGFTMVEIITYVILSKALASQFSGGINHQFSEWIYDGTIGIELNRPVNLFTLLVARRIGEFLFYVVFKAIPVLLIGFLILGGAGPAGAVNLLLFLISVLVSVGIMFYIEMLVGMGCFYTLTSHGLNFTKTALMELLSGGVVPLFLFPDMMEKVLNFLPFAGMVSVPVNIFLGKYSLRESLVYIGIQCFWVGVMYLLAHGCFSRVIKKVVVQGG